MAQDPAFLMYYHKWLTSTAGWDADIRGWYINLLCHQADKPDGLPADIESLADLAGVKISQYDRFKLCWKHTLESKFSINDNGLLVNEKQKKIISDRREYANKQSERGVIGYYIKLARRECSISNEVASALYKALEKEKIKEKTKEDALICFKHTLEALMRDINSISNTNKNTEYNAATKKSNKPINFAAQGADFLVDAASKRLVKLNGTGVGDNRQQD